MIRDATLDDLPGLLALGARMHAESPHFSRLTFSPEVLEQTLRGVIASPHGFLRVGMADGKIAGVFVAMAFQHWCSTDLVASDLALFVEVEHRGSMLAARLIAQYKHWARATGVKPGLINAGVSTGIHVEQTTRLYEACGFKRYGVLLEA